MKKDIFNMPKPVTIMGRSSSITNSFVNGIIPCIQPTEAQIQNALKELEQSENDVRCVYCGDKKTEWDHLHPLIIDKKHTGYITEIANLVPACSKCNQSKGNSNWKEWMTGDADKSPKTRKIPDLDKRIQIIEKYDAHFEKRKINLEEIAGKELWEEYQKAYNTVIDSMKKTQALMEEIKSKLNTNIHFLENAQTVDVNDETSPIVFKLGEMVVPAAEFKIQLLATKKAERRWYYKNGVIECKDFWIANHFTEQSNLLQNIKTSKKFLSVKSNLEKLEIVIDTKK